MNEEPRDWEITMHRNQEAVYAQHRANRTGIELLLQGSLTKEEALAMLATMGDVRVVFDDCFYVTVKK